VLIDPSCLDSLSPRQVRAGYAEIVKYALIDDAELSAGWEQHGAAVLAGDPGARRRAIAASVAGKARIVEQDERETSGRRALLNLGHTFGHALEAETGYSDRLLHGEAVAVGIVLAFDFSAERGCACVSTRRGSGRIFRSAGFHIHRESRDRGRWDGARRHMLHDKKRKAAGCRSSSPRHRPAFLDRVRRTARGRSVPRSSGMSRFYAEVIGDPIAHSRSPEVHNRWLAALGLAGEYRAVRVAQTRLGSLARRREDPCWRGCNVTIPHKEAVLAHLDRSIAARSHRSGELHRAPAGGARRLQ
jgi:hypothetical protein